jgi:DNA-binding LacI/PurR family transcriptional regulator
MADELAVHGLDFFAKFSSNFHDLQQIGFDVIREIAALKERPDVIIFHDDEIAMSAIGAAFDLGLKIPDDISVVSYGRTPVSGTVRPTLATYDTDWKVTAELLTSVTLKRLENPEMPFQQIAVTAEFVPGNSLKNKII